MLEKVTRQLPVALAHIVTRERENDLTLINTIKLELEIKQLKERLNNAEREIKEKNIESSLGKSESKPVQSIGIQSNLSEIKERDDSEQDDESVSFQNRQQICTLQEKLQEFERWKEEQILQNSEFLNKVNSKIQEISASLEITRNQIEMKIADEMQTPLSSADDLEEMLTKKVHEIGKTAAANLEDIAKKIEINYNEKLQLVEKELNKLIKQYIVEKDRTYESAEVIDVSSKLIDDNESNPTQDNEAKESRNLQT
ncbi:hypothetical protein EVAR_72816_1 [Eumeta japonica]|uniref:Uncharacterized protein n=1 Tax=Eumeta variegata TaxID=151549 RepID=A0A4C1SWF4_EUMVA|nr:hypothetical protein EVAR_72816_1 [Eumeta japonica]